MRKEREEAGKQKKKKAKLPKQDWNVVCMVGFILSLLPYGGVQELWAVGLAFAVSLVGLVLACKNHQKGTSFAVCGLVIAILTGLLMEVVIPMAMEQLNPGCYGASM